MANVKLFIVVLSVFTVWIAASALVFGLVLDFYSSPYFNVGPSANLYILGSGICVDTWPKYCILLVYLMVNPFIAVYAGDTLYPWINAVVMNPDIKTIDISKPVAWIITNYMWGITSISYIFSIGLGMTQIDFYLASTFAVALSGFITSYVSLSGKEYEESSPDLELGDVNIDTD